MLVRLLYASRAAAPLTPAVLDSILEQSRANNPAAGITGVLCFSDDLFIQVLEGGRDEVCGLYNTIVRDNRHAHVCILSYEEIRERRFGGWTMGQVNIAKVNPTLLLKYSERAELNPFSVFRSGVDGAARRADRDRVGREPRRLTRRRQAAARKPLDAMMLSVRSAAAIVLAGLIASAAAAEPIAASRGRWAGPIGEQAPGKQGGPGRIELRVDGTADRFTVDFAGPGGPLVAGEFSAGQAARTCSGRRRRRGLMSYLGRGSTVNPLEGKPLAWARREGETLIVYRLDLRGGAHRLDRLELKPSGERIGVVFERREHDRALERFTASLERSAR